MHVKQRNLLLFGAFCCCLGAGLPCGSGIAARCNGEAGLACSTLTKTQDTVGNVIGLMAGKPHGQTGSGLDRSLLSVHSTTLLSVE